MTNPTVFVACKFRPEDTRTYTYTWDGETLAPGDMVKVADARSDGWKRVIVDAFGVERPNVPAHVEFKPILGRYEPDEVTEPTHDALDLGDDADLEASLLEK